MTRAGKRHGGGGRVRQHFLSDDDGKTWRQARRCPPTVTLTAVHFVDDKTGWAVGHDTVVMQDG